MPGDRAVGSVVSGRITTGAGQTQIAHNGRRAKNANQQTNSTAQNSRMARCRKERGGRASAAPFGGVRDLFNRYSPHPQLVAWFRAIRLRLRNASGCASMAAGSPPVMFGASSSEETRGVAPPHILITGMGIGQ